MLVSSTLARMAAEVRAGLSAQPLPWLPCKYFYDDRGSALFEQITRLPEYYQTRTEERILERVAADVVAATRPVELLELGSGVGRKVRLLIDAGRSLGTLKRCLLLDINAKVLAESVRNLEGDYPGLCVRGVVGDFQDNLEVLGRGGGRLALFLAGTIGNLHPDRELPGFLRAVARQLVPGDAFLVGIDVVKDEGRLHAAYNDAAGVTAEFNRNILRVVNAALDADFDPDAYDHVAFYDRDQAWIEMRLRARHEQRVRVPGADLELTLRRGQEIRTELSCKYTRATFETRLTGTGLRLEAWLIDAESLFALALLRRTA
jgi:L-histidine N-alpha-methyltransferase